MEEEGSIQPEPFTTGDGTLHETAPEHKVFPPFDATTFASQLLWFAITFAVFYYIMAKVALPRIASILEGRRGRIAADLDQAEKAKTESEQAGIAYDKALAEARARASGIAEAARAAAKADADRKRAGVEADLGKRLEAAEARIADIKSKALAEVGGIAGDTTEAVVKALVDADVTAKELKDAVAAALAERKIDA